MKKVLSILLAVLMLASLCTIAVTSVSAEETTKPTWAEMGVYDGTGAYSDQSNLVQVDGEWAIKMPGYADN